jgi:hypothetical protein
MAAERGYQKLKAIDPRSSTATTSKDYSSKSHLIAVSFSSVRGFRSLTGSCERRTESKKARAPKSPLPLNLRPLAGGYFFLLADFLAAGFLALDFCCFDLADLLAIMILVFWSLTPLRHVSFPAEQPSMAARAAAVNHRSEVTRTPTPRRVWAEAPPWKKASAPGRAFDGWRDQAGAAAAQSLEPPG